MKSTRLLIPCIVTFMFAVSAEAQTMAGSWNASIETQIGVQTYTFDFAIDGTTVTGTASSANGEYEIEEGTIEGSMISFVENMDYQGMPLRIVYTGTLEDGEIRFTRDVAGLAMEEFVAKRPPENQSSDRSLTRPVFTDT